MTSKEDQTKDIYYYEYPSEVLGQIWLAATSKGLVSIRFDDDSGKFISNLVRNNKSGNFPSIIHNAKKLSVYINALKDYCENKTPIPLSLQLDLSALTEFQQLILQVVQQIPFGSTTTYGEIADEINNPNASRAIGQVLRRNPIPIIIPCHRVLSADGTLGGYGGVMGSERKIALLKHEGVILA